MTQILSLKSTFENSTGTRVHKVYLSQGSLAKLISELGEESVTDYDLSTFEVLKEVDPKFIWVS